MKLCALTQSYAPTGGGVRTLLHAQRDYCREQGIPHVLIVPGAEDEVVRDAGAVTYTIRSPFVPGSRTYRLLLRSDKVLRILKAERPDVIEAHCAYNLPWTALLHRWRHGGLVSGIYNTDVPTAYVETPLRRRVGAHAARLMRATVESYVRALYSRCDVVVAISPHMRDRLHAMGVHNVELVPLGVDTETFTPALRDDGVRARYGADTDDLLLIYAGRLDAEKRPDVVLEAFAQLPPAFDAVLLLVGDGPLAPTLQARAQQLGRAQVVPFVSDRQELARLLASADIYISGMAHETFGLSVVEAQASGLAVLGVAAGAMRDRVQPGEGFLVAPAALTAMAQRIVDTPREEWRRMGERARARVAAEFSWSRTFETLFGLYNTRLRAL